MRRSNETTTPLKRIVISPGEPAGIGPDLIIQLAALAWSAELIVVADPILLKERAACLNLTLTLDFIDLSNPPTPHQPGVLKIIPVSLNAPCEPGKLNQKNAAYVITVLETALAICLNDPNAALVTGPIQKSNLNEAGIPFTGHTEFLADYCNVPQVLMLFVTPLMKVALATTHVPLAKVPSHLTTDKLTQTLRLLHHELIRVFHLPSPTILVAGLNPHAGEHGFLGREEIDIIEPALRLARAENINVLGPFPADTLFNEDYLKKADAILAMYHDQALPVVKFSGFHETVNVTLGLPMVRTSVDHGTALTLAGLNLANPGSLSAAIQLAIDLNPH